MVYSLHVYSCILKPDYSVTLYTYIIYHLTLCMCHISLETYKSEKEDIFPPFSFTFQVSAAVTQACAVKALLQR